MNQKKKKMPTLDITDEEKFVIEKLRSAGAYATLKIIKQANRVERVITEQSDKPSYPQEAKERV